MKQILAHINGNKWCVTAYTMFKYATLLFKADPRINIDIF